MPVTDYYVTSDAMGSATTILDADGNVLERRTYDAFGDVTCMAPDGTVVAESPTGVDVGFQGQIREDITGLYQMGYRWYNPVLGRWLSRDLIGLAGGVNVYTFVGSNPLSFSDPLGLWQVSIYGGDVFGGYFTFGNNGGTGGFIERLYDGQWNVGVRGGVGEGVSIGLDVTDLGKEAPGWSANLLTAAGSIGEGGWGSSVEIGLDLDDNKSGGTSLTTYVTLEVRCGYLCTTWTGGCSDEKRTFSSFGGGIANKGNSFFIGSGLRWRSE